MNTEKIERLLEKYFEGKTSLEEEEFLRSFFRNEKIPDHLKSYRDQFSYISEFSQTEPGEGLNPFAKIDSGKKTGASMLSPLEEKSREMSGWSSQMNTRLVWTLRIAAGFILLLVGFSAGLLVNRSNGVSGQQVAALEQEVQQMKTALVYGSDRQLTASERISAVKISERVPGNAVKLDAEITDILIHTLNNDPNINVREAAAEALFRFRDETQIRKALVNSLSQQSDPLMQMTLINMLVELKEKSAINKMQKLLMDSDTRDVVKTRLEIGIAELKT